MSARRALTCLISGGGRYAVASARSKRCGRSYVSAAPVSIAASSVVDTLMLPTLNTSSRRCLCSFGNDNNKNASHTGESCTGACWRCGKSAGGGLFCAACGAIQAPGSDSGANSYYQLLFGPNAVAEYRLDAAKLAKAMRQLQWQLHPDKFASASEEERSLAQQQSARVNQAYACLNDPVSRAVYLLSLRGVAMPTEETGSGSGDLSLPQEFLAEMLELNEAVMEADRSAIGSIADRVEADTAALVDDLGRAFDEANDLALAKELTYRLRYFANIRTKIRELS